MGNAKHGERTLRIGVESEGRISEVIEVKTALSPERLLAAMKEAAYDTLNGEAGKEHARLGVAIELLDTIRGCPLDAAACEKRGFSVLGEADDAKAPCELSLPDCLVLCDAYDGDECWDEDDEHED